MGVLYLVIDFIGFEKSTAFMQTHALMFYCVNDETITIGEHLALLLEPRKRIALR